MEWMPTECAPKDYPIQVHSGTFLCEDGSKISIPNGAVIHNGWGNLGSIYVVGDDVKSLPTTLQITWLSFVENQFYTGEFKLSSTLMQSLFEKGFLNDKNSEETYTKIMVGMAPGGVVAIWLLGGGSCKEIGFYEASKTDISMSNFNPNGIQDRAQYVSSTLEDLSSEIILADTLDISVSSGKKWEGYRKQYTYRPKFESDSDAGLTKILVKAFNGELYHVNAENQILKEFVEQAAPRHIWIQWEDTNQNLYGCDIYFDEQEVYKVFEKIEDTTEIPFSLKLRIDKYNSTVSVSVENEKSKIEIKDSRIKVYPITK